MVCIFIFWRIFLFQKWNGDNDWRIKNYDREIPLSSKLGNFKPRYYGSQVVPSSNHSWIGSCKERFFISKHWRQGFNILLNNLVLFLTFAPFREGPTHQLIMRVGTQFLLISAALRCAMLDWTCPRGNNPMTQSWKHVSRTMRLHGPVSQSRVTSASGNCSLGPISSPDLFFFF